MVEKLWVMTRMMSSNVLKNKHYSSQVMYFFILIFSIIYTTTFIKNAFFIHMHVCCILSLYTHNHTIVEHSPHTHTLIAHDFHSIKMTRSLINPSSYMYQYIVSFLLFILGFSLPLSHIHVRSSLGSKLSCWRLLVWSPEWSVTIFYIICSVTNWLTGVNAMWTVASKYTSV
jgi:hypothetical protein